MANPGTPPPAPAALPAAERSPDDAPPAGGSPPALAAPAAPGRDPAGRLARLVGLGFAFDALALLWMASSLPAYAAAFHVRQDVAGLVFTTNSTGFVLTVPLAGILADRWGKRAVAAGSALCFALGLCLFAASPDLPLGLLAAVIVGAGAGSFESTLSALLPDLYPGREGYANNIAQVFFSAGAALAPVLLLVRGLGWRLRLAALGTALALMAPAFAAGHVRLGARRGRARGTPAAATDAPSSAWLEGVARALAARGVGWLVAAMMLYTGVEVSVWGWLYAVLTRPGGPGPLSAVAELSGFWLAMGLGRWLSGRLSRIWPLSRLIAVEAAVGVPALCFALLARGGLGGLLAVVACGLAFSGIWPSVVGLAQERHGDSALLTALMVGAGGAGGLLIPAGFGFLAAHAGLVAGTAVLAALLAPVVALPFAGAKGREADRAAA